MKTLIVVLFVLVAQTLAAPPTEESKDRLCTCYCKLNNFEIPEIVMKFTEDIKSMNLNDKTTSEEKKKEFQQTCYKLSNEYIDKQTGQDLEDDGQRSRYPDEFPFTSVYDQFHNH